MPNDRIIRQYVGRFPRIDDPLMKAGYIRSVSVSEKVYGPGTADWDQKATQVVLNEKTADYLYTSFTPLSINYQPGSRPVLERLVNRLIRPEMSEREKVFAILKYCHGGFRTDYPGVVPENVVLLNASEEDILQMMNSGQCESLSRVIICLCQVAGISARFVASYSYFRPEEGYAVHGGHAIVEIYLEGGWAFFDSVSDLYCLRDDGNIASLWDLLSNPGLVETQPDSVYKDCGKTKEAFIRYRDEFLTKKQVVTLTNYYVWDYWRYDWKWAPKTPGLGEYADELRKKLLTDIGVPADKIK
jgi:transglutaminase-like putative cysteine protease